MKDFNYITLHHKKMSNQATQGELEQLDSWIGLSPDNKEDIDLLEDIWESSLTYEPSLDIDEALALNKFKSAIKASPTPEIISLKPRFSGIFKIAASLTVFALASFLVFNMLSSNNIANTGNEISVVSLDDGSELWLSPNTEISYDKKFNKDHRTMDFAGKAFFDVKENADLPFVVNMGAQSIQVIGTSFNLTYRGKDVILEVLSGIVKFRNSQNQENTAKAGQSIVYDADLQTASLSEIQSSNTFSWKERSLSFDNTPLELVFKDLENYYEIDIDVNNINISDCTFSSPKLSNASLDKTLDILKKVAGVEFSGVNSSNDNLVLSSVNCIK